MFARSVSSRLPLVLRTYSTTARPFEVLGIQQIAIGGLDKQRLAALWTNQFGLPCIGTFQSAKENVDEDILLLGSGPWAVEVDLMQPLDPNKSPKVHATPLNHIGLWVTNLAAAVDFLTARGMRFTPGGIRKGAAGYNVTFIHPKGSKEAPLSGEGVLVELVEVPSEEELAEKAKKHTSTTTTKERPFNVLGLQQVAIGGLNKAALSRLYVDVLGLEKHGSYRSEKENVDEDILRVGKGKDVVEIDLMQPLDPNRAPKVHEPPLNHLGLWVDNLQAAVDHLTREGVRFAPGGIRKGAAGYDVTFIHPKGNAAAPLSGEGVLIELVQAPAGLA